MASMHKRRQRPCATITRRARKKYFTHPLHEAAPPPGDRGRPRPGADARQSRQPHPRRSQCPSRGAAPRGEQERAKWRELHIERDSLGGFAVHSRGAGSDDPSDIFFPIYHLQPWQHMWRRRPMGGRDRTLFAVAWAPRDPWRMEVCGAWADVQSP